MVWRKVICMNRPGFFSLAAFTILLFVVCALPIRAQSRLAPGQMAEIITLGIDGSDPHLVYQTAERIEAPNWTRDGKWLVYNSKGSLWRIAAGGGDPIRIDTGEVKDVNNDHVLSPDGRTIFFSAGAHIYAVPFEGGVPRRVSNEHPGELQFKSFLHGVSPDGRTLAFVGVQAENGDPWKRLDLYTIPSEGGAEKRLTDTPAPADGPEYSPDGKSIYFNSELHADIPGHAQCYRMNVDGSGVEQLTRDERVNWFPHISPDGKWIVYLSFPPGTVKHPADKQVILRRMRPDGSEQADILSFLGGQGTINVNSWSPDSKRFAFVRYPQSQTAAPATAAGSAAKPPVISLWEGHSPVGDGTFQTEDPQITIYRPDHPNGASMVICPGGGYGGLVMGAEGSGIAQWLNQHGITGVVLKYRLPRGNAMVPLLDAQRALRMVRFHSKEWDLDPHRVGIIGFSAGGHLASTAGTHFDNGHAESRDAVERMSSRPDFMILIYPVISMGEKGHAGSRKNLLGATPSPELIDQFSNEKQVTAETPPAFLAHAEDDKVDPIENSQMFLDALLAKGVVGKLLRLPSGGHGLNGYKGPMWDAWQTQSMEWLAERKIIPAGDVR